MLSLLLLLLAAGEPRIELQTAETPSGQFAHRFVVHGLSEEALAAGSKRGPGWSEHFTVTVVLPTATPLPPMLGDYRLQDGALIFEPRFPLRPGTTYRAELDLRGLGPAYAGHLPTAQSFALPRRATEPARVLAVFPSGDRLPENLLKFYVHFSAPMSRGEAYERIQLLDAKGTAVESPFLELGEELWDPSGSRFTLFFDPGRIKRGLQPRELFGPALEEGRKYTLLIDERWRDARGDPLAAAHRKVFTITAPDDVQPDVARWKIHAPPAGSRDRLRVEFDEPLDQALLERLLWPYDGQGTALAGTVEIGPDERSWSFTPKTRWQAGRHHLHVDPALEDQAGNSVGRPFEVDVLRPSGAEEAEPKSVHLPFDVP